MREKQATKASVTTHHLLIGKNELFSLLMVHILFLFVLVSTIMVNISMNLSDSDENGANAKPTEIKQGNQAVYLLLGFREVITGSFQI